MRRLAPILVGAILLASAAPAQAGSVAYLDAPGDATALSGGATPRPSDAELDLLRVEWATTADELVVTTRLSAVGVPLGSHGWAIGQYFTYQGIRFELLAQDMTTETDRIFGDGVYLRPEGDSVTEFACVCRLVVRPDTETVTVRLELHSLGSAARAVNPRAPKPRPGLTLEDLSTVSYRAAGFLLAADRAAAPKEAILTI